VVTTRELPISSQRLLLRPFAEDDFPAIRPIFGDSDVMRYVPGGACDDRRSLERLRSLIAHQRDHRFSKWAVVKRTTGDVIGDCGLQYLDGGPEIELGFHLHRAQWGHGYATEAAGAALSWAQVHRTEDVVAIVDPGNDRSLRVLERIGMSPDGTRQYLGRSWTLYRPLTVA
jgi:RimJ/RimL family protein N-acetyltransferase